MWSVRAARLSNWRRTHTFVDTSKLYHRLPIEGFGLVKTSVLYVLHLRISNAIGTKIVKIGSTSINDVRQAVQQFISQGESDWFVMDRSAGLITPKQGVSKFLQAIPQNRKIVDS